MKKLFSEILNKSLIYNMKKDKKIICYGLGINDPKNIFGTTKHLKQLFSETRVFDMPTSENCMTGVGVGLAIAGFKPIMVHQRMDFFLLAFDQLINNAAKWNFMFGNQTKVPFIIRLIVGRGWGQGPTHSQSFHNLFANIPGLKIVTPCFPEDVPGLLNMSINSESVVIFIEHRWCHQLVTSKKINYSAKKKHNSSSLILKGKDITIVSFSYSTIEVMMAYEKFRKLNISIDHISLNTIKPLDYLSLSKSIKKTKNFLFFDNMSNPNCSIGDTVISKLQEKFKNKNYRYKNLTLPDKVNPTSYKLSNKHYLSQKNLVDEVIELISRKKINKNNLNFYPTKDVPNKNFKGPF